MPVRTRAGSSPVRNHINEQRPELPRKRRSAEEKFRRGSIGVVNSAKQRARRDTTTSSDVSSETDAERAMHEKQRSQPAQRHQGLDLLRTNSVPTKDSFQEDARTDHGHRSGASDPGSIASSLSSELAETADSASLLGAEDDALGSSLLGNLGPPPIGNARLSPKKARLQQPSTFHALPPPRPVSTVLPGSALGQALRARQAKPKAPEELFARFSGKGSLDPLNIRIYAPFSDTPTKPFEMPLQRNVQDLDTGATMPVVVADAIGLSLWRYLEESLKPPVDRDKADANRWTLRIMDETDVDYDFPPLNRAGNVTDFTSNNNRPARGRPKGKAYDDFALVEATESQYAQNKIVTPKYTKMFEKFIREANGSPSHVIAQATESALDDNWPVDTVVNRPFALAPRKGSATLDQPSVPTVHSTPRTGPSKILKVTFTSLEAQTQSTAVEATTDTYLAEVLDLVCKRWHLDKAHHFLRVTGTTTVAPPDRTVEVLGTYSNLDLVRRRFANAGSVGLGSSPASSSPNAPLILESANTTPPSKRTRKAGGPGAVHPLSNQQDAWSGSLASGAGNKRYVVIRKQPMSFAPSHPRTLLLDGEYLHILPGDTGGVAGGGGTGDARAALFETGTTAKTISVPFSMIVGCKVSHRHPKNFRVIVFRESETKRYDFEAQNAAEAEEIVGEVAQGMQSLKAGKVMPYFV